LIAPPRLQTTEQGDVQTNPVPMVVQSLSVLQLWS
jgi:hypothetical protein